MTASATVVGLPPDAPSHAEGGGPASLDEARAKKREQDREAKRRQRDREKSAKASETPEAPRPRASSNPEPAPAPSKPTVRFRDGSVVPAEVLVDRITLEQLASGAATAVASVTKDGRAFLLANLRLPSGRTMAGDVGYHAEVVLAMQGVSLTPEATAYANLLASLGVVAAVLTSLPKMELDAAATALPEIQKTVDAALGNLSGGRH